MSGIEDEENYLEEQYNNGELSLKEYNKEVAEGSLSQLMSQDSPMAGYTKGHAIAEAEELLKRTLVFIPTPTLHSDIRAWLAAQGERREAQALKNNDQSHD